MRKCGNKKCCGSFSAFAKCGMGTRTRSRSRNQKYLEWVNLIWNQTKHASHLVSIQSWEMGSSAYWTKYARRTSQLNLGKTNWNKYFLPEPQVLLFTQRFYFGWITSTQIYWHNIYSLTIWLNVLFISFQKYMYIKIECAHSFYVVSEFCNLEGIQILFASKVKQQRMFKERKAFEGWGKNVFVTFLHEKNSDPQQHWPYSWIAGFNLWPSWQGWVNPAPPLYV